VSGANIKLSSLLTPSYDDIVKRYGLPITDAPIEAPAEGKESSKVQDAPLKDVPGVTKRKT